MLQSHFKDRSMQIIIIIIELFIPLNSQPKQSMNHLFPLRLPFLEFFFRDFVVFDSEEDE